MTIYGITGEWNGRKINLFERAIGFDAVVI